MNAVKNRWDYQPFPEDMILFFAAGVVLKNQCPEYDSSNFLLYNKSDSLIEKENFLQWLNESALPILERRLGQIPEDGTEIKQWTYDEGRYHIRTSFCGKCGNCIINGWATRK